MRSLSDRSSHFTDSVIRRMTRVAASCGAINLSQGFPDFDPPRFLMDRLSEVAYEDCHQYAVTWGAESTRRAIAGKMEHFSGLSYDSATEVTVTCGSTEAMMASVMSVTDPGDSIVIFSPFYENYGADAILAGAAPIYVPLNPPSFTFDADVLEDAFRCHPKALILCNPSNPCGKVFTKEELETIAFLARKYDVYVITDEVYEHIVYAPNRHTYISSLPGMRERTICCSSLSKTYSITGWRLGYTLAPPYVSERIRKVHDFLTVGAAAPLQEAVLPGLLAGDDYYDELRRIYTEKRDFFLAGLDELGIIHTVPQGAYYVMMDISEYGYDSDEEFALAMAEKCGVAAVPGSSFFREAENRYVRLHFAKKKETLSAALDRMSSLKTIVRK